MWKFQFLSGLVDRSSEVSSPLVGHCKACPRTFDALELGEFAAWPLGGLLLLAVLIILITPPRDALKPIFAKRENESAQESSNAADELKLTALVAMDPEHLRAEYEQVCNSHDLIVDFAPNYSASCFSSLARGSAYLQKTELGVHERQWPRALTIGS